MNIIAALAVLRQGSTAIAALTENAPCRLAELMHETTSRFAEVDSCYFCLYDASRGLLRFLYHWDDGNYDDPVNCQLGDGPTSCVVRTGIPFVLAPDNEVTQNGGQDFGDRSRVSLSAVHLPLLTEDSSSESPVLGVFSVQSYRKNAYAPQTVALLELVAQFGAGRLQAWKGAESNEARIEALERERCLAQERAQVQSDAAGRAYVASLFALGQEIAALRPFLPPDYAALRRAVDDLSRSCHRRQSEVNLIPARLTSPSANPHSVPPPATQAELLTERERDIARLLTEGLTNKTIAGRLFISADTVNFHVKNVYRKLGVSNRTQAGRHFALLEAARGNPPI